MRSRVAAPSVITEAIPRPSTASVSSGSSGSPRRVPALDSGVCSGAWITEEPSGVGLEGGFIAWWSWCLEGSKCMGRSGNELLGLTEPPRGDQPGNRRRGFRAEAALFHGHRDHDRPVGVADVGHVPGLVFLPGMFRGARLAVDRVLFLIPTAPHVRGGAAGLARGLVDALHLSLIHISEPTRQAEISYAVFCLKKKKR